MKTFTISSYVETEDGENTEIIFTQKDADFIYMTVGGGTPTGSTTYKIDLREFILDVWTLETRRRDMEARMGDCDTSQDEI